MSAEEDAVAALRGAGCVVALTGAGASTESGIPDFRSAGGLWERYPPESFATIDAFNRDPDKVWGLWYELAAQLRCALPNAGHRALAALEQCGKLETVITQNIDNLHQAAGNTRVIEYHGNASRLICMSCHARTPLLPGMQGPRAPRCSCGGVQKPDVVFFGEMIPPEAMLASEELARECDVMIIVGTSAQVYPAAGLPYTAKRNGAYIIECNVDPTDYTGTITDAFLRGKCGQVLPRLVEAIG